MLARLRLLTMVILALGLLGSLAVAVPASAEDNDTSPTPEKVAAVDSDDDGVLDAPDSAAAAAAAASADKPVEDLSQRTETDQILLNPDGTRTLQSYADAKRVQNADGTWDDIDLTLKHVDGGYRPVAAPVDSVFSDGGDKTFVNLQDVEGKDLKWQWPATLPTPTVEGNTLTYKNVIDDGDLVVTALPTGFSHSIILHSAPAAGEPLEIPIPVSLDGANIEEASDGSLSVTAGSKELATSPAPLMWDAAENAAGDPANITPVEAAVEQNDSKTELVLTPDADMLNDPDTSWPVTIDPAYVVYSPGSVWVQSTGSATNAVTGSSELRVGTYDSGTTKARSFLKFNPAALAGTDVVSATLRLRNFSSYTCDGASISVNRITEAWDGNNVTWSNQPTVTTSNQDDTSTTPYGGPSGCSSEGFHYWDVRNIAQLWADDASAYNFGLRLKAVSETYNGSWRKYRSTYYTGGTEASQPRIDVTFNSYPEKASTPTSQVNGDQVSFQSQISDPDGGNVRARFLVKKGTTTVFDGYSEFVPSGTVATTALASLPDGTYTVQAWANDGSLSSKSVSSTVTSTLTVSRYGNFVPLPPAQLASTVTGIGLPAAPVTGGSTHQIEVAGVSGIPDEASAVFASVRAENANISGALRWGASNSDLSAAPNMLNYQPGVATQSGVAIPLGQDGSLRLFSPTIGSSVDLEIDIQGYFINDPEEGGAYHSISTTPIYNSSTGGALGAGETRTVKVTGLGGIPQDGTAGAADVSLTVMQWTAAGSLTIFNADEELPSTSNLKFSTGAGDPVTGSSARALTELSNDGEITVSNTSPAAVQFVLTASGWFGDDAPFLEDDGDLEPQPTDLNNECMDDPDPCEPLMASGTAPGDVQDVRLYALPADLGEAEDAEDEEGIEFPLLELSSVDLETSGHTFEARVNPAAVPSAYVDEEGIVDIQVDVVGDTTEWQSSSSVQSVVTPDATTTTWADPIDATLVAEDPPASSLASQSVTAASAAPAVEETPSGEDLSDVGVRIDTFAEIPPLNGTAAATSSFAGSTAASTPALSTSATGTCSLYHDDVADKKRWSTLGTTYAVGSSKAAMKISTSKGAYYGAAVSAHKWGDYSASGQKWTQDDWGYDWTSAKGNRSYKKEIRYRHYALVCDGYIRSYGWKPVHETGGTGSNTGISQPYWDKYCSNEDKGTFYRKSSHGHAYEYGASVKFKSVIGVDLKIKRQYATEQKLVYYIASTNTMMCGSNDDPAYASKLMQQWQ